MPRLSSTFIVRRFELPELIPSSSATVTGSRTRQKPFPRFDRYITLRRSPSRRCHNRNLTRSENMLLRFSTEQSSGGD